MFQSTPLFRSALMLTGVHLLLRSAGTAFHVFLSRRIGASGLGLLQLVLSVGNLAMVAAMAGIRTATMYLTAEELGKNKPQNVRRVLSGCLVYSILCSGSISLSLLFAAPMLAQHWIGNVHTVPALRVFAAFLPVVCLCGVMSGYFTAANRIKELSCIEIAEQAVSITVTLLLLFCWAGNDSGKACISVILGSSAGACLTLVLLVLLRLKEHTPKGMTIPLAKRLIRTALPLGAADCIRSGISTTENLMVPKRLALYAGESAPLSAFGRVHGMVFPIMMFPACILFALAELLIPELARCHAAQKQERIRYLVRRSLWAAMLYGVFFGGMIFLFAESICQRLYRSPEAGQNLQQYAMMIPFLYCDAITDAMTKGLGQQKKCVRYNIFTSSMDVVLLFLLLPRYGMQGYFFSFLITHLLNFLLSLRLLCRISGVHISFYVPVMTGCAGILAVLAAMMIRFPALYPVLAAALFYCFGVMQKEDLAWGRRQLFRRQAG